MEPLEFFAYIGQLPVSTFLDALLQALLDRIKGRRPPALVGKGAQFLEAALLVQTQPIGNCIDADTAQSCNLTVWFAQILQFNAEKTTEDLSVTLVLLASAQFFLCLGGEMDFESHGSSMEGSPSV